MDAMTQALVEHQKCLQKCSKCSQMVGPVITGEPVLSPVYLMGQAPGAKEGLAGRPFAWTAGKTLFKWFAQIGLDEEAFRQRVFMAAVCRCFPGKNPKGGDRVPDEAEMNQCANWMNAELALLNPQLILPVGKLAIGRLIPVDKLKDVVGRRYTYEFNGVKRDVIPLPHPSGVSTWHRIEPGKTLLLQALQLIKRHAAWKSVCYCRFRCPVHTNYLPIGNR